MDKPTIKLEDFAAEKSKKVNIYWKVSTRRGGEPVNIPITIINGIESGPTVWIQAGLHGDEYQGIAALLQIARDIKPEEIHGQVVLANVVNTSAYESLKRESGTDNINLNTVFPGSVRGTTTHVLAATLIEEVVRIADYAIDLHGGGMASTLYPYTLYWDDSEEHGLKMAKAYGTEVIVKTRKTDSWADGMFYTELSKKGIPTILPEAGYGPQIKSETVNIHVHGVYNILHELNVLKNYEIYSAQDYNITVFDPESFVKATSGGFARVSESVSLGSFVEKGIKLVTLYDVFGNPHEEILAPVAGILLLLVSCPVVGPGQTVAEIGKELIESI